MGSTIEETITHETGLYLLGKLRDIHKDQTLCGEPRNALFNTHDDLLLYLLSLLRGDAHFLPEVSIDEWKKLLDALRSHWITPLLYYKIGNSPPEFHPPGEILDQMRFQVDEIGWLGTGGEAVRSRCGLRAGGWGERGEALGSAEVEKMRGLQNATC